MADKTIIHVQVQDQKLVLLSGPVVATGGVNATAIKLDLSSEWDGMVINAVFQREGEMGAYHSATDSDLCAIVPQEILKDDGYMVFGIYGVLDDTVRTSELTRYRVRKGTLTEGSSPSSPTPELWEQLLNAVNEVTPAMQQLRQEMDQFKADIQEELEGIQGLTSTEIDAAIEDAETAAASAAAPEGEDNGSEEIP